MKIIDISNNTEVMANKDEVEDLLNMDISYSYFFDRFLNFNNQIFVDVNSNKVVPFDMKNIEGEHYIYLPSLNDVTKKLVDTLEKIDFTFDNLKESNVNDISKKSILNEIDNYFIINDKFFILNSTND